jgi:hypothetical protein
VSGFTTLEAVVLEALCSRLPGGDALRRIISSARVRDRENTGHGFYTRFSVDPVERVPSAWENPTPAGAARLQGIGEGVLMGFLLWSKGGVPECLEGFQYGDEQGNTVDLKRWELGLLRCSQLAEDPNDVP